MNKLLPNVRGPARPIVLLTLSFQQVKLYLIASIVLALLAGCSASANRQTTPTPIPTPVIPVKPVYEVQRGDIVEITRFTGRIAPIQEEELAFGVNGRVDQVQVKAGDIVQTGALLAMLDTGSQFYDLRRAQIQVELAQLELDLAQQQMLVSRQTNNTTLMLKEAQLEQAQITVNELRAAGYTGGNLRQSEIELELTRLELDLARQQITFNQAADEVNHTRKERELELTQLALSELEALIANSQIVAPFDGRVVSVYLKEDTAAEAYKPAIILADMTDLLIRVELGSSDLQRLEEGMVVSVSRIGEPGSSLAGGIQSLPYPYGSGESGQKEAYISLDQGLSQSDYDLGDLMEITVILAQKSQILWLPPHAIRTFEGRKFVVIQEGEGQRRVDVKIGIQAEDRVEILEGLVEGQVVLSP